MRQSKEGKLPSLKCLTLNLYTMRNIISMMNKQCCLFILGCFCLFPAFAQNVQITGKVLDKENEAIIGASVVVKGTTNGTITDLDGNFVVANVPEKSTIQISYIGYKTQEFPLAGKTHFNIVLQEDTETLDEVIVVGYGVQRKSDLTGSVGSVKASDALKNTPVSDITSALQGRLAGVSIMSASGAPGSSSTIRVRGSNSLQADGGPLIVIDGLMGGSLSSLNPSDIASVEVLKDASATAVYGSKGANGVILITTKSPESGKVNVEYNGYVNFKTPYTLPDMLSPAEFAELANDYGKEFNASAGSNPKEYYTQEQIDAFNRGEGGYDYINNVFRDVAIEHTHELSISGGSEKTKFLFSGSYNNNEGIAYKSWAERFNYRLKVDTDIRKWLKAGLNFWGDYTKSASPNFSNYNGTLIGALTFPNTIQPTNEVGDYNNVNLLGPQYNPMVFINELDTDGYKHTSRLQGYVDITLAKGLTFRMTQGFTFGNKNAENTYGLNSYQYYQTYGNKTAATAQSNHDYSWINTNVLSYVREFNKNNRINATAVIEQQSDNNFMNKTEVIDLISSNIGANNTGMGKTTNTTSERIKSTMLSYMLRVNYALMNRYMITASWRYDGSSRPYYDNRWASFYAVALAWNIKQEKFMENVEWMDQFKLRFGYGETGNQAIPQYSAYTKYDASRDANDNLVISTESLGNKDLKWERTSQYNVGLDLGFFKNRLTLSLDVYDKKSKDVLLYVNSPLYTGFASKLANAATIRNRGFEITIGADPVVTKNFNWNTDLTLSSNKGWVEKLADGMDYANLSGKYEVNYFRNMVGKKIATMYGYVNEGVWTTEEVNSGKAPSGALAGSYKYKEIDGKEGITPDDRTEIGNGQPSFQWGWNNSLNYKGFDLGLFIIGVHGFDIYNYTREACLGIGEGSISLGPNPEWKNRWQAGINENATVAGFVKSRNQLTPSSQYVEKGDFVKVKSITLGYSLPSSLLQKATIKKLRIYVSLQNPFLFTGYSGIDPEVTLKTPLTSGIDWGYYPNGRNYLIGLNLAF